MIYYIFDRCKRLLPISFPYFRCHRHSVGRSNLTAWRENSVGQIEKQRYIIVIFVKCVKDTVWIAILLDYTCVCHGTTQVWP